MSSEQKVTEVVNYSMDKCVINYMFINKECSFIYAFMDDVISIFNSNMVYINTIMPYHPSKNERFRVVKQNVDDSFIIITNFNFVHYQPPNTFTELLKYKGNFAHNSFEDILISPNGKYIVAYRKGQTVDFNRKPHEQEFNTEIIKFCNYKLSSSIFPADKNYELRKWQIIAIDNNGFIFLQNESSICKVDNSWQSKTVIINNLDESRKCCDFAEDGKILIYQGSVSGFTLIDTDTLKISKINRNPDFYDLFLKSHKGLIYILEILSIVIYDISLEKVICKISVNETLANNGSIIDIIKINDLIIIYNNKMHVFVYDANTGACIKIFKATYLDGQFGIKVKMPTSDRPIMIIYNSQNVGIIYINAILEKQNFLLGSLVHDTKQCALNNFINSPEFDRHLIPLIFGFLID